MPSAMTLATRYAQSATVSLVSVICSLIYAIGPPGNPLLSTKAFIPILIVPAVLIVPQISTIIVQNIMTQGDLDRIVRERDFLKKYNIATNILRCIPK